MTTWVVITSRAGVYRKGEWLLAGHTLVEWALQQTKDWMPNVIVTTDQPEVMVVARRYGAHVVARPDYLAGGEAGMQVDAMVHALRLCGGSLGDIVHLVQPTSPFVTAIELEAAELALLDAATAQTVYPLPHNHHEFNQRTVSDGLVSFAHPAERRAMQTKQEKPVRWAFGNLVSLHFRVLIETRWLFTEPSEAIMVSELAAWDVDTRSDLAVAECIVRSGLVPNPFNPTT